MFVDQLENSLESRKGGDQPFWTSPESFRGKLNEAFPNTLCVPGDHGVPNTLTFILNISSQFTNSNSKSPFDSPVSTKAVVGSHQRLSFWTKGRGFMQSLPPSDPSWFCFFLSLKLLLSLNYNLNYQVYSKLDLKNFDRVKREQKKMNVFIEKLTRS